MSGLLDSGFDLLVGFGNAHIMIIGILAGVVGAILSTLSWIFRWRFLKALPGLALVVLVPMLALEIIPGLEFIAVPAALGLLFLTFLTHLRRAGKRTWIDIFLAVILAVALLCFVAVQAVSVVSGPVVK